LYIGVGEVGLSVSQMTTDPKLAYYKQSSNWGGVSAGEVDSPVD